MKRLSLLPCVLAVVLAGCAGGDADPDRPPTHPTTGVVTYKGNPVPDATVTFVPESPSDKGAFGRTDAEGRYQLTTFESGDGAITGRYVVTITKFDTPIVEGGEASEEEYVPPEAGGARLTPPKNLLPTKYAQRQSSDLTAQVTEGNNTFDFQLVD